METCCNSMPAARHIFFTWDTPSIKGIKRRNAKSHSSRNENRCAVMARIGGFPLVVDVEDPPDSILLVCSLCADIRAGLHMLMMPDSASGVKLVDKTGTGT